MNRLKILILLLSGVLITAACAPTAEEPVIDIEIAVTNAVATMLAEQAPTATEAPVMVEQPTATAEPTATMVLTPPVLSGIFTTDILNPLDPPHTYISDTCSYLGKKWGEGKADPGTVLVPIMFHSITKGEATQDNAISMQEFKRVMDDLKELGFEAVSMQQAVDFIYDNAYIPKRSALLIVDDRHYREYFDNTFRKYYEDWGWVVVNSWINQDDSIYTLTIQQNVDLSNEGWVDYQSHGYVHNEPMSDNSSDEYLTGELTGSMQKMERDFGKTPIAVIWPGGGFGVRPAEFAMDAGYKVAFTINPRGPIMFNWVPLSDDVDPMRPSFIPEGPVGYPLMTLPRYWDTDIRAHLDDIRNISGAATEYEKNNKDDEIAYYNIVCAPTYGNLGQ